MNPVIIFNNDLGTVSVVYPAPAVIETHGIHAIARQAVPPGVPYKVIDAADVPLTRELRAAWIVDDSEMTDGFGSDTDSLETPEAPDEPAETEPAED